MIIIRNTFIAKPGKASTLATQLKAGLAAGKVPKSRVLTDLTGDFNRVVMETEVEDLGGVEANMKRYQTDDAVRAAMQGYTDLFIGGHRELLQTA